MFRQLTMGMGRSDASHAVFKYGRSVPAVNLLAFALIIT
jgi:hypothetical protein